MLPLLRLVVGGKLWSSNRRPTRESVSFIGAPLGNTETFTPHESSPTSSSNANTKFVTKSSRYFKAMLGSESERHPVTDKAWRSDEELIGSTKAPPELASMTVNVQQDIEWSSVPVSILKPTTKSMLASKPLPITPNAQPEIRTFYDYPSR